MYMLRQSLLEILLLIGTIIYFFAFFTFYIQKTGIKHQQLEEASTLITATTSLHLPESFSTNLTIKLDSVLTNPIGKGRV